MGQYLKINGDYNIKTAEGGSIVLDTGPGVGNTRITGNLIVEGSSVNVSTENLIVADNIIVLNNGEIGNIYDPGSLAFEQGGVTLRFSGLQVDRGPSLSPASFVFDEFDNSWSIAIGQSGLYNFADSNLKVRTILTNSSTDDGDLTLIGSGTGVVKVSGTDNYRLQVTDPDDIPNKDYVDFSILNNPTFQILSDRTTSVSRVIIADKDLDTNPPDPSIPGSTAYFENETGLLSFGESSISIIVDELLSAQFFPNRAVIQEIEFVDNEITNSNSNSNIILKTNGTGKVETRYAIQLNNIGSDPNTAPGVPASISEASIIYSDQPGVGTTGLYFVNTVKRDEMISKNKALVFSMLF
jgi:hypothetical protein